MTLNEWNTLKKVVVGVADYATIPPLDISFRTVLAADKKDDHSIIHSVDYPIQVIEGAEGGARCILIIVRALKNDEIKALHDAAYMAGMEAIYEIHEEKNTSRLSRYEQ